MSCLLTAMELRNSFFNSSPLMFTSCLCIGLTVLSNPTEGVGCGLYCVHACKVLGLNDKFYTCKAGHG